MFRAGKLWCVAALLSTKDSSSFLLRQRHCIHFGSFLQQGLVRRSMAMLSATAQVTGGGKQNQTSHEPTIPKTGAGSTTAWPRKIFSGIQPTGSLHLGNYLGAVRRWVRLQNAHDDVTVCIVDMHSITMPHNPPQLRENILNLAATLLACGIDPAKSTFFVQSAVPELSEFNWILSSLTAMPRLAHLPQFREKSRLMKDVPLGLYVYPVLQAADIMLYKATHVPVGADQLQHIQLAQHLAKTYNSRYGETFPVCEPMVENGEVSCVLSLLDPGQKMSKSNLNGIINLTDSPDLIKKKINSAVTDFASDISYSPGKRPGVSNLISIHSQVTGQTIKSVVDEASTLDTAKYKERVAEAVIEHLTPIRELIHYHLSKRKEVIYLLEVGASKARQQAQQTLIDVKQRLGLGTSVNMPAAVTLAPQQAPEVSKTSASRLMSNSTDVNAFERHKRMYGFAETSSGPAEEPATEESAQEMTQPRVRRMVRRQPMVPAQSLRVEKQLGSSRNRHVFKMDSGNAPHIGFKLPPKMAANLTSGGLTKENPRMAKPVPDSLGSFKPGQNAVPSAVSVIAREVNAPRKQEFTCNLANSGFYAPPLNAEAEDNEVILLGHQKKETTVEEERHEESEEELEWENAERKVPEKSKV
ncbi:tryptophan--tRNA ligase, mitochondrial isoform X2 [Drosophila serrata]|uniref:tryptophan--tRNA ligase, mitochondrial isoform X2 n=1 Tax=Drosophila serrata TaxID=7274 RepID=UPI000A1D0E55|nr:tryptophan--tRNA ligase, mitochondrial isoform X2 [Drosophila serrata]